MSEKEEGNEAETKKNVTTILSSAIDTQNAKEKPPSPAAVATTRIEEVENRSERNKPRDGGSAFVSLGRGWHELCSAPRRRTCGGGTGCEKGKRSKAREQCW